MSNTAPKQITRRKLNESDTHKDQGVCHKVLFLPSGGNHGQRGHPMQPQTSVSKGDAFSGTQRIETVESPLNPKLRWGGDQKPVALPHPGLGRGVAEKQPPQPNPNS